MKYTDISVNDELIIWEAEKYSFLPFRNFSLNLDGTLTQWQKGFFSNYDSKEIGWLYRNLCWHFHYKELEGDAYRNMSDLQKLVILLSKVKIDKNCKINCVFYDYFIKVSRRKYGK